MSVLSQYCFPVCKPFIQTDASADGIGAILLQEVDSVKRRDIGEQETLTKGKELLYN